MATIDATGVTLHAFVAGNHNTEGTHANRLKVAWMHRNPDMLLSDVADSIEAFLWKCLVNEVLAIEKQMASDAIDEIDVVGEA